MTQINKLTESPTFEAGDKMPIYNKQVSRTRSLSFENLQKNLKYVSDITVSGSILTVHYSDGTQKDLTI